MAARASFASTAASSPSSAARRSAAFEASALAASRAGVGAVERVGRLLGGLHQRGHRRLGLGPGLLGLPGGLAGSVTSPPCSPSPSVFSAVSSSSILSIAARPISGPLVELLQPQLALAEARAQVAHGRGDRLGAGPDALHGAPGLGQPLAVLAPLVLAGRDLLLDRGAALADLLELFSTARARCGRRSGPARRRRAGSRGRAGRPPPGRERSSASSTTSFAVRSAASAWRFSGRRRERASRSTSRARSRFSRVRSSFSWARWRRLRCLPRPGGLLDQQAAVAGLGVDDRLDPALADDRVHLPAHVRVGEHLEHVGEAAAGAVEAVLAVAVALDAAGDRDLGELAGGEALGVVDHDLDLGEAAAPLSLAAGEDHVAHRLAADREGLCSPSAQSTASVMLDLPQPFGPTITLTPWLEGQPGAVGERLEPLEIDLLQVHAVSATPAPPSIGRRSAVPFARAPRGPAPRRPARPPSCCGPSRRRPRRRRRWRGPRSAARGAVPSSVTTS